MSISKSSAISSGRDVKKMDNKTGKLSCVDKLFEAQIKLQKDNSNLAKKIATHQEQLELSAHKFKEEMEKLKQDMENALKEKNELEKVGNCRLLSDF